MDAVYLSGVGDVNLTRLCALAGVSEVTNGGQRKSRGSGEEEVGQGIVLDLFEV